MCTIDWDLTIKALTLIVVIIGAWKGLMELKNSQKWKRAEFLAQKHKEFGENTYVQKAMRMLDGFSIYLSVDKNELDGQNEFIDFKPEKLTKALSVISDENQRNKEEVYIRLCLDKFLFRFGNFQNYLDNDLADKTQVENLLGYWINAIGDKKSTVIKEPTKTLVHNYIKEYKYDSAKKLLETFGYYI